MLRIGILIKKSEILENAQKINTVVFDKTGTLTYGKLKIAEVINYSKYKEDELLQIVGSIEAKSTHPIGKAFTDYLEEKGLEKLDVADFENIAGLGIKAKVNEKAFLLGNAKMLENSNISNEHIEDEKRLSENGNSIVYVIENNAILAIIGINDIVRENAKSVIDELNKRNVKTIMLTRR